VSVVIPADAVIGSIAHHQVTVTIGGTPVIADIRTRVHCPNGTHVKPRQRTDGNVEPTTWSRIKTLYQ
jgi:hypothetical protein